MGRRIGYGATVLLTVTAAAAAPAQAAAVELSQARCGGGADRVVADPVDAVDESCEVVLQ